MTARSAVRLDPWLQVLPSLRSALKTAGLLCLFLLFHAPGSTAQTRQFRFEHIQLTEGLTEYRAYDLAQDSIGFLWIATDQGLYRHDGLVATVLKPRLNDTAGVSGTTAWCLLTDHAGLLWIGTFDAGLECLDPRTGTVRRYAHDPADPTSINFGPITSLAEDRDGRLWVGTERDGLGSLDPGRQRFSSYRHDSRDPHGLSNNSVKALAVDRAGRVWVGTNDGLNILEPGKSSFQVLKHNPADVRSLSDNRITGLCADADGAIWAGTRSAGVCRMDPVTGKAQRFRRAAGESRESMCDTVLSVFADRKGFVWIGTVAGLYRLDPSSRETVRAHHNPFSHSSVSGDYIRAVRTDRTGTIWVVADWLPGTGTQTPCVNKIDPKSEQFAYYRIEQGEMGSHPVVALLHDETTGTTWIGCESLRAMDQASGSVRVYLHQPADPRSLSDSYVSALWRDGSGTLWVGTWNGGVNRYDPSDSSFARHRWTTRGGDTGGTVAVICDAAPEEHLSSPRERMLWIGTFSEGVHLFSERRGIVRRLEHVPADSGSLGSNRVLSMVVDRRGVLWVGTDGGGLNRWDRSTGRFIRYSGDPRSPSALRSSRILSLLEDERSYADGAGAVLWVGTATGLDRFDEGRGSVQRFYLRDSSESIGIIAMIQHAGHLWVGTTGDGIFDLPLHGGPVRAYGIRNGLPTNAFLRARWATPGGRIFFGTGEGFITFHPDSLNKNPYPPRVVLTAFSIFDEPFMSRQPIWSVAAMRLSYDQDFFSFRFAALDYTDPSSNSFLYRLDGFEEEWNRAGTRTFASYTGVDPGDYTFRVRAANSDGVWDEAGLSVGLHIDPPYWRTWWFRSLVIIALAGLAAAAYRYRVAKLLEMERMRVRIASDLHDDIGSSLSGIALVTESLKNRGGLEDGDRQHLADVSRTARRTADALRDIVWLVNPQHDTVNDLFLRMKDAASMVLTGTEYSISTSGESATRTMSLDFRHQLILIYKEILNNIAKHARARHVSISISLSEDGFMLRIEDDGVGFDPTVRRSGNGLVNLQRRGAAIKGKLSLESTPGRGTVVTLTAPLG